MPPRSPHKAQRNIETSDKSSFEGYLAHYLAD